MREVPESVIRMLDQVHPGGAAAKALADAAEIRANRPDHVYRFLLTENGEVCVQEGIRRDDIGER